MTAESVRFEKFCSALYRAASGLESAIATAPDFIDREGLARAEAEVRLSIRRHHLPSPDEERIFLPPDPPPRLAGDGAF